MFESPLDLLVKALEKYYYLDGAKLRASRVKIPLVLTEAEAVEMAYDIWSSETYRLDVMGYQYNENGDEDLYDV